MSRLEQIQKISTKINREAKKSNPDSPNIAFIASGNEALLDFGVLSTGNVAMDEALGGGFPKGNIVQLIGAEGVGKSCAAIDMIAYNQRVAKEKGEEFIALYLHFEASAFPLLACINAGIDLDYLLVVNALDSAEKTFDLLFRYLWDWEKRKAQNLLDMVVIDSITAASPEAEIKSSEESLSNSTIGRHAAMTSKALRILSGSGALGKTLLMVINQYRTNIGGYGSPQVATGGKAMGYYPKISVSMTKPSDGRLARGPKTNQEVYGHTVKGSIEKNNTQLGKPYAKFEYQVIYGQGIDLINPVIDIAINRGIIQQGSVGWFDIPYNGENIRIRGKEALQDKIKGDTNLFNYLQGCIANRMSERTEVNAPGNIESGMVEDLYEKENDYVLEEEPQGEILV